MDIEQEAKTISTSIIDWCFRNDVRSDVDENYPTHIVENLLKRQKKECIEKACEWLYSHCSGTSEYQLASGRMVPYNELVEQFRQAMEE